MRVIGASSTLGNNLQQLLVTPVDRVVARDKRWHFPDVLRQITENPFHLRDGVILAFRDVVDNPGDLGVDIGATQGKFIHLTTERALHHGRAAAKHASGVAGHHREVTHDETRAGPARTGAHPGHQHRHLAQQFETTPKAVGGGTHRITPRLGLAHPTAHVLDTLEQRDSVFVRQLLGETVVKHSFVALEQHRVTTAHGKVVGTNHHRTSVDFSETGDERSRGRLECVSFRVKFSIGCEGTDLRERTGVNYRGPDVPGARPRPALRCFAIFASPPCASARALRNSSSSRAFFQVNSFI